MQIQNADWWRFNLVITSSLLAESGDPIHVGACENFTKTFSLELRPEKCQAVNVLLQGTCSCANILAVLPTRFGKSSMIFQPPPPPPLENIIFLVKFFSLPLCLLGWVFRIKYGCHRNVTNSVYYAQLLKQLCGSSSNLLLLLLFIELLGGEKCG